jgi:hypothetical protein
MYAMPLFHGATERSNLKMMSQLELTDQELSDLRARAGRVSHDELVEARAAHDAEEDS